MATIELDCGTVIEVGDWITAGEGCDRDAGCVQAIDPRSEQEPSLVTIGWESGVATTQEVAALSDLRVWVDRASALRDRDEAAE